MILECEICKKRLREPQPYLVVHRCCKGRIMTPYIVKGTDVLEEAER